ncbi:MAG: F0F1 ATP synthase subunit alpha [Verrucomicrobia bacterium]|nr:F0F1 ATP synthase subunit alpha [Verrucomicrobiota bacterium]
MVNASRIQPEEVTNILAEQIDKYRQYLDVSEVGRVILVGDGIARIYGLDQAMAGELIRFPGDVYGMVFDLSEDNVGAILLGSDLHIREGDEVRTTGRIVEIPVGETMCGRVINSLGQPIDGKGPINTTATSPIEKIAPGVVKRQPVCEPLQTGLKAIDSMVPIGRGQRELIIGDRQTGKTALAVDTIINQRGADVVCIYVAIGQKKSSVASVMQRLEESGALEYTVILNASAADPAPMQFLAPYAGCAVGEYFRDNGKHALVVYDDLSKHAVAYRQMSLLLRRPPGREAYPGDIFYCHSRLLERAAKMKDDLGAGSLTALPIIETQAGEIASYIPANVISITDGQIYLESDLFFSGVRPAINVGNSVSRVGGAAQVKAMKQVAGRLRLELAQYREIESFAQFGSELDKATQDQIARGRRLVEVLKQGQYEPMGVADQVIQIFAVVNGFLDDVAIEDIRRFEAELLEFVVNTRAEVRNELTEKLRLDEGLEQKLKEALTAFKRTFASTAVLQAGQTQPDNKTQVSE